MVKWIRGPVGMDAGRRTTMSGCRTVLVLVPHVTAGTRLLDLVPLLEADHRVQIVFSVPDGVGSWHGTTEFVRRQGGLVLPWHQAVQVEFDLVLAASRTDIDRVHGKVLTVPHGASCARSALHSPKSGSTGFPMHGLDRQELMRDGRVVPAALCLTHDSELKLLRISCPEAVPVAVVTGDLCLDRMVASKPFRAHYRRALRVHDTQKLVVVSSTWGPRSTFGRHPGLIRALIDQLPPSDYVVASVLHPNISTVHGHRQVQAWLSDCVRDGLRLLPPEEGWRAAMVAADHVVGDHGSTTQYAAAIGIPVTLAVPVDGQVRPGSLAEAVGEFAPALDTGRRLQPQLSQAVDGPRIAELMTSRPGRAGAILRSTMYRLLELDEPARQVPVSPVPLP